MPKKKEVLDIDPNKRLYQNDDIVIAGYQKHRMKVIDAILCVKGWRYQLGFMKKDGTLWKGRINLFFFADNLKLE